MDLNLVGILIFAAYMLVFLLLVMDAIRMRIRIVKLSKLNAQLVLDRDVYLEKLNEIISKQDNKTIEETQGFVKFISESRDWAFQYIEDVQQAISDYQKIADAIPLSHDMSVEQAQELSKAYDKLINFLPREDLL